MTQLPRKTINLASIEIEQLKKAEVKGIILDLDNTIVSEDDQYISPGVIEWISQIKAEGVVFFLLSNGKRKYRVDYWSSRLDIPAISPAKKPLPFNFYKALEKMQLRNREIIVIGDSLHTDVFGAWLIGAKSIQVCSLHHPPRWWEQLIGKWLQIAYPNPQELWKNE